MNIQKLLRYGSASLLLPLSLLANPTVYISLGSGNGIGKIDTSIDKVVKVYDGAKNTHGLVATPDGEYVYAGSLSESKLYLVHPAHGHIMSSIPIAGSSHHQAITPDGRYVLSAHPNKNIVSVIDTYISSQVKTIETEKMPNYVVTSSDGKYAYVSNTSSGTIQEISIKDLKITRSFKAGISPNHLAISKDNKTLYIANAKIGSISILPLDNPSARKEFKIAGNIHGLDVSDDGKNLFIASPSDSKLYSFNIKNEKTIALDLSPSPYHVTSITGTNKIYATGSGDPIVWVVDQKSFKTLKSFKLPIGEGHQMTVVQK